MALPKTGVEKFDSYTEEVQHGRLNVCKWVRLAVERHYRDMERQSTKEFPYYFESKACMHFVDFFETTLHHFDGIFKGMPVLFEPWQYFTFASPFSWICDEWIGNQPVRRFNESVVMVPKKQGKSLILGGTKIYMMYQDGYPGAQVWILATSSSHAQTLSYRDAVKLVKNSPELSEIFRINRSAGGMGIYYDEGDAFIRPLVSNSKAADGPKIHMAGLEEIKDWDQHDVYETIVKGTAADVNSMICSISTAGSDMTSLGYERQDYAEKVLTGEITDERLFGIIYTIDKEDRENWDDMEVVQKANPNFGVSVHKSYYESELNRARQSERKKNEFLTKHQNVWINSFDSYFTMEKWMDIGRANSELKLEDFEGQPCYLFLDLASRKDICPAQLLFRYGTNGQGKKRYVTFGHYFLPSNVVSEDLVGHRADYNAWAEMGLFQLTPGSTTDFDAVKVHVRSVAKNFRLMQVGMDDWAKDQFSQDLTKMRIKNGVVGQRVKYLSDPMKDLEAWLTNEDDNKVHDPRIIHNGDPVLTWAMSNVVAKEDANENVYPRKEHKNKKIDPAVALINLLYMESVDPLPKQAKRRAPKVMKL